VRGKLIDERTPESAQVPSRLRLRRRLTAGPIAITAFLVAVVAFFLTDDNGEAIGAAAVAAAAVAWTQVPVARALAEHGRFLPLMRASAPLAAPLMAFAILASLALMGLFPLGLLETAALCAIGGILTLVMLTVPTAQARPPLRVAVVGSAGTAADLQAELRARRNHNFEVVGHIRWGAAADSTGSETPLGSAGALAETVVRERLDVLLVAPTVPRMSFFEEVEATLLHADVRVLELASFYERVFGHIALRAINAAWFQWVMHPRYSPRIPPAKRAFDLIVTCAVAVVALPLIALLAMIIKLEGGSAFYRQQRIGEGGRLFAILKLRTMRPVAEQGPAQWSTAEDKRVTRLGRLLRRTHLDELPQIFNVLRGDMSIVGPRPEQPEFVESLEDSVAFYSRRHTVRPGITGWAQVRCGYAGSHEGTLWKLSHDLYYLKHRSVTFDLLILGETLRTLVADKQFPGEVYLPPFVHEPAER
jgi:exopolysaccharide biosynthesis polyprenyl glycosylphosphotransferase